MNRLTKIADKYCYTDKGTNGDGHLYTEFYQPFFEKFENPKILEFGTYMGGSAHMFNDFFDGNCEIWTCDIGYDAYDYIKDIPNIHFEHIDLNSQELINKFKEKLNGIKFDIIIDDAEHVWWQQLNLLYNFHDYLNNNGIYIIEDLQNSRIYTDPENSPLYFLNFLSPNIMLSKEQNDKILSSIKDVQIFNRKNDGKDMVEYFGGRSITSIITFNN